MWPNPASNIGLIPTWYWYNMAYYHWSDWTHWGWDQVTDVFQTTFSNAFFHENLKMRISNTIRLIFVLKSLVDNTTALLQIMARHRKQATDHFLNQWWPKMATHIYIIRAQWVNVYHMYPTMWNLIWLFLTHLSSETDPLSKLFNQVFCNSFGTPPSV